MERNLRLEVRVYIPINREGENKQIITFVNPGARELDKDEIDLFASGAGEVEDKSFRKYKKFLDKAGIDAKGNVNEDPMYRVLGYKSTDFLIDL